MFRRRLLSIVRPRPTDTRGLVYFEGTEENGRIRRGKARSPETGETYSIKNGYLDLMKGNLGADNIANFTNFLPGAGRGYEPLWRRSSLSLLTGERFPNEKEIRLISLFVGLEQDGRYLDLGCSAGLYTRNLAQRLGDAGDIVGIDISPSMLKEAARQSRRIGAKPSFVRADAENLPFADGAFDGAVCGGSLNEFGDPARALRETARVLKPGGRVAIMGILKAETSWGQALQRFLSTGGVQFFGPEELHNLLEESGFVPEDPRVHGPVFLTGAARRS
ncbi:MAG: class I SAM-dependent methyltransferase [Rubrobacteraceae bacterium]